MLLEREDLQKTEYLDRLAESVLNLYEKHILDFYDRVYGKGADLTTLLYFLRSPKGEIGYISLYPLDLPSINVFFQESYNNLKGEFQNKTNISSIYVYQKIPGIDTLRNNAYDLLYDSKSSIRNRPKVRLKAKNALEEFLSFWKDAKNRKEMKRTLTHELQHYLDNKKNKLVDTGEFDQILKKKFPDKYPHILRNNNLIYQDEDLFDTHQDYYFNKTTEYNAYTLENLNDIRKDMESGDITVTDFEDFKNKFIKDYLREEFWKRFNDKHKKKVINRLYLFWEEYKQKSPITERILDLAGALL